MHISFGVSEDPLTLALSPISLPTDFCQRLKSVCRQAYGGEGTGNSAISILARLASIWGDRCEQVCQAVVDGHLGLPTGFQEFEPHFVPKYRPWQQRLAFCPEADIFKAAVEGKLTVVTDTLDTFTEKGVLTTSGEEIEADIIVAATGFRLSVMGDIPFEVDGNPVDWHDTVTYRGMMFTGVPNLAWVMGYFRASWTLRVDMLGDFICGLLNHMDEVGASRIDVALRDEDADMSLLPWIEEDNFNPNYLMRDLDKLPRRGDKPEWRHNQDYWREREEIPAIDLDAPEFLYDGERRPQPREIPISATG